MPDACDCQAGFLLHFALMTWSESCIAVAVPGLTQRCARCLQFVKDFKGKTPSDRLGALSCRRQAIANAYWDDFDPNVSGPLCPHPTPVLLGYDSSQHSFGAMHPDACNALSSRVFQPLMQFLLDEEKKARAMAARPTPMAVS